MQPTLEFINHASVLISNEEVSLLSDPWYQGDAFHKGWNLIHELSDDEINGLLNRVTHIWISHEHPDHFSVSFFIKFKELILSNDIKILFQKTNDKRVESFLLANKFNLITLEPNKWIKIANDYKVLNFKDGFYDSGLAINTCNMSFLNLNDCEIKTNKRCNEVYKIVGACDVLISQFSYAAWKGGKENVLWRMKAAEEKLNTLEMQVKKFNPKYLIPFASFVNFSNEKNFYLNDSSNTPREVINKFKSNDELDIIVMKPFDILNFQFKNKNNNDASIDFWDKKYSNLSPKNKFEIKEMTELNEIFDNYKKRIFKNNSKFFIRIVRLISPIRAFQPLNIYLDDIKTNVHFDIFSEKLEATNKAPDVEMSSESLYFVMQNTFGFDTLTVNGCFEEKKENGFAKMTKSLAIENLNNIGIKFDFYMIFNFKLLVLFLHRLKTVSKKINNT
ncbi:MBL fold metallo-hydrolase [Gammaproteobacteria bacterium]|nr:MBL fold metallo-hydrolase [Gammaproteobacteria bacterium]